MKNDNLELLELKALMLEYCRQRGFLVNQNPRRQGIGTPIAMLIQNGDIRETIGVMIKDWKRSVGIDVILRAEDLLKMTPTITKVLIVSNLFSEPAQSLAKRVGILLLTRLDLIRILTSDTEVSKGVHSPTDDGQDVVLY
ncbi:MAG: restriction endonuclease [Candidatus Heimdallarchaeota archaeon]